MTRRPPPGELFAGLPSSPEPERDLRTAPAAEPEQERPTDTWRITGWPVRVHAPYDPDGERERGRP